MAKVYNIQKFKDNMKELIRNDVLIDKFLNIIKNQNEDGLFLINEKFNLLKDDF
jgi:Txe/YoeB family toxin of Txe-Axe toxin-antitoxin module